MHKRNTKASNYKDGKISNSHIPFKLFIRCMTSYCEMWDIYRLTSKRLHLAEQGIGVSNSLARYTFFVHTLTTAGKEGSVISICISLSKLILPEILQDLVFHEICVFFLS